MKLSYSCAYALHALASIARRPGDRLVPSHTIAAVARLPEGYLLQVLGPLVAAKVLLAMKGHSGGGYRLAWPAKRITPLDVVEAVDGPVRRDVPRWAAGAEGARLDGRLPEACAATAEVVRARLRKVSVADRAGGGSAPNRVRRPTRVARGRRPVPPRSAAR